MTSFNPDQEKAINAIYELMISPETYEMILTGDPGTGKSWVTSKIIEDTTKINQLRDLVNLPKIQQIFLTATTNQATDNLRLMRVTSNVDIRTIYSLLTLVPLASWECEPNGPTVRQRSKGIRYSNSLLIIDEASWVDPEIRAYTHSAFPKHLGNYILYVGDKNQTRSITSKYSPIFDNVAIPHLELTINERRKDILGVKHPITVACESFKDVLMGKPFKPFKPDGEYIIKCTPDEFEQEIIKEFSSPNWKSTSSKVLAYRNSTVITYNTYIQKLRNNAVFNVGDVIVSNSYVPGLFKNNQMAVIRDIYPGTVRFDRHVLNVLRVTFDEGEACYCADTQEVSRVKNALAKDRKFSALQLMERTMVDMRHTYASTIDKAQGSTYDKVFVDIKDIGSCRDLDRVFRMLYVGFSRPREKVYVCGDISIGQK